MNYSEEKICRLVDDMKREGGKGFIFPHKKVSWGSPGNMIVWKAPRGQVFLTDSWSGYNPSFAISVTKRSVQKKYKEILEERF